MSESLATAPRNAWILLLLISVASFTVAEYLGERHVAIAIIMLIAGIKAGIVLFRFMDLGEAPRGIRVYFLLWTAVCSGVPIGLWWLASA